MADHDELLAALADRVRAAPDGPEVAAVFDYDGTLIEGFSGVALFRSRLRDRDIGPFEAGRAAVAAIRGVRTNEEFEDFLRWALRAYEGRDVEELREWGREVFRKDLAPKLRPEVWQLLELHRIKGHTIMLASSATELQLGPIAEATAADVVLCTRMAVKDGKVTGEILGEPLWNHRKAAAVIDAAVEREIDLTASFAYSDGDEDVPLLESVGNPTAVNPRPVLRREARQRGWPILDGVKPGASPNPVTLARTAAFYSGFATGTAMSVPVGIAQGSVRKFIDTAIGLGADLGLGLGGIDVEVVAGERHLWAARPCVFIFNHRSNLDGIILMTVLRRGITAVAKKEVERIPGFGQLFKLSGVAFIDRADSTQAREAIRPVIERIREDGLSLAIAPEGTRWPTPGMGPFKKGAFHIARQAGVPIVPVVIKGAGELLPKHHQLVRPGKVEVVALEPVDVVSWPEDGLAAGVETVRRAMLDTLLNWPG